MRDIIGPTASTTIVGSSPPCNSGKSRSRKAVSSCTVIFGAIACFAALCVTSPPHGGCPDPALAAIAAAANSDELRLAPPPRTRDNRFMLQAQANQDHPLLTRVDADGIAFLTLDRPRQRN